LRVVELLEPTLAPAPVIWDDPLLAVEPAMTIAPMGLPATQPGTSTGVDPRKKNDAREKPKRAVLRSCAEKTCCSCALRTCSRRLSLMRARGFCVGVLAVESSMVYTLKKRSLGLML